MATIETSLQDGTILLFEVEPPEGLRQVRTEEVLKRVEGVVNEAMQKTVALATEFSAVLQQIAKGLKPNTASLKLGVKLGAEGGIVVAKASTEANLVVTLTWQL